MKNLMSPETLAFFKQEPSPIKEIVEFLDSHSEITTPMLCKLLDINTRIIYDYRHRLKKIDNSKKIDIEIAPKNASKKQNRYSAEEKLGLIEKYNLSNETERVALLRRYGIYQSDITNWQQKAREASLEALGHRKIRSDKKSDELIKIEELERELQDQEKTTAKLSTLLMLQKKTFDFLKKNG
jgi:transposase-like protein